MATSSSSTANATTPSEPSFLSIESIDAPDFGTFVAADAGECILGIDEAGRGPVLGPMVYGCALVRAERVEELKALGVDDSKALSEAKRMAVLAKMEQSDFISYTLRVVHPRVISVQMKRRGPQRQSLNDISHSCAVELIRRVVEKGIRVKEVFVDLVGRKEELYQAFLLSHFPSLKITVSKRADALFPVVGAASIAAKVARDERMRGWVFEEVGYEPKESALGSGYPSDPLTKRFISSQVDPIFGFPSLFRFSWKPVERLMERRAIKCEWNYEKEALDSSKPKQCTLTELWAAKKEEKGKEEKKRLQPHRRHVFFSDRGLSNVTRLD